MEALGVVAQPRNRFEFDGLKSYSRAEVDLINWFCRAFRRPLSSVGWRKDAFAPWLDRHQGTALRLTLTNEVEPRETRTYRFANQEIRIGRSDDNEIVLGVRALGKQHARLVTDGGNYYLEDAGSAIGTYLNDRKLKPGEPALLNDADRFLIFPFSFVVKLEEIWVTDDYLQLSEPAIVAAAWSEFEYTAPFGFCRFEIGIYPDAGTVIVEGSRPLLETIVSRLTRMPVSPLVEADYGVFEFLIASVLEEVNRELAFPLQAAVRKFSFSPPAYEPGFKMELSIALPETTGVFRLFLPRETLAKVNRLLPAAGQSPAADLMTWGASLSGGRIELGLAEFSDLEPGDVLLFAEDFEVLLPPYPSSTTVERGWKVQKLAAWPFRGGITKYFERSLSMQGNTNGTGDPFRNGGSLPENLGDGSSSTLDLSGLPVRLHVILGQIELSLSDLNSLTCNSVVELDRAKGDPVQIAVNGKIIGSGLLVEIEGTLGVEISKWSGC